MGNSKNGVLTVPNRERTVELAGLKLLAPSLFKKTQCMLKTIKYTRPNIFPNHTAERLM